jgi:DegV family protein with EDD domain
MPVRKIDGPLLGSLLLAGIRHLFQRREYINRINVFPVPDADTGTNLSFTFKAILDVLEADTDRKLPDLLEAVAEAALDGARGNAGAIMAQYIHGCREASGDADHWDARTLARVCREGARASWTAMAEPVAGTMPSVMEGFAEALEETASAGETNLRRQFSAARDAAQAALDRTPEQLPVLKQSGVVDAGGQGFVDLLEGIHSWVERGVLDPLALPGDKLAEDAPDAFLDGTVMEIGDHQFCTECVIEGDGLDRLAVLRRLEQLDQSSLVVAGGERRVRVHVHVNNPGEVFLACEDFGDIVQQKADDMRQQHGLLHLTGSVAVVTDSGADLPDGEVERLGLHVVPVRVSFGEREFLDGVSLRPPEFYRMLDEEPEFPKTSQPPPQDFRRVFELLTVHGYEVLHVGLSSHLSGTTQAARAAAERVEDGSVKVFDSLNASGGQGLLALAAAEAAAEGLDRDAIEARLARLAPVTRSLALPRELTSAIRGGRVPAWIGRLAGLLRLTPIFTARDGKVAVAGVHFGRERRARSLARRAVKLMEIDAVYRVLISHADHPEGARELRRLVLERHPRIHSCHIADAGPALGAHFGRGALLLGFMPDPHGADEGGEQRGRRSAPAR